MRPKLHRDWIDPKAFQIVENIQKKGFQAYLVGGCVRDLLSEHHPKDYDIATSATPEEVRKIIPHSYLIGRRFQLVLVRRGVHQYEVSTFRRSKGPEDENLESETIVGDNFFGTVEEDAVRRDFTVNALFYDPIKDDLLDFCHGMDDIKNRTIKVIGEPDVRIHEDPIRILRGIRLAHKLGFSLEENFLNSISRNSTSLLQAILPRKREEYLKILKLDNPMSVFVEFLDLGILQYLLPSLNELFLSRESMDQFITVFNEVFERLKKFQEPWENFSKFLYALIKTHSQFENKTVTELSENDLLQKIMKEELGVFRQESTQFFSVLSSISSLQKLDHLLRKGERRRQAFLNNPQLPMGLEFCYHEKLIKYSDYFNWKLLLYK